VTPTQRGRWERDQAILAGRTLGASLAELAVEHELTVESVRQVLLRQGGPSTAQVQDGSRNWMPPENSNVCSMRGVGAARYAVSARQACGGHARRPLIIP